MDTAVGNFKTQSWLTRKTGSSVQLSEEKQGKPKICSFYDETDVYRCQCRRNEVSRDFGPDAIRVCAKTGKRIVRIVAEEQVQYLKE